MTQVSIIAIRALTAAVASAGGDPQAFMAEAGLTAELLEDSSARVSLAAYARARRAALSVSGNPALGLHMGGQASTGRFDLMGALAENSRSLRDALEVCLRYGRIVLEGPRLDLTEEGELCTIHCLNLGSAAEDRLTAEFVLSSLLFLVRRFVGDAAQVQEACFAYPAPAHRHEYTRVFGGRERFDQPFTGLVLERSWLARSHAAYSHELSTLLTGRAELLLARVERDLTVAERVRRWLAGQDLRARPTMTESARALGMSPRSLRRRLHEENSPFPALLEDALLVRAKTLLADASQSVQEAAFALGFESPAAFSRAFKRWTGMAPSAYREAR